MSVILFVGPSGTGKTFTMREYVVPALLADPAQVTQLGPAEGYHAALIADPPTVEHPQGQYSGPWYDDVAEWRRAEKRSRVARFRHASLVALCDAGARFGRLVICLDDMERELGTQGRPSAEAVEVLTRGRLHGCVVTGACRRLKAINTFARSNVEIVYFGSLTDEEDRAYAAKTAGVHPDYLRPEAVRALLGLKPRQATPKGILLEWRRETGEKALIRVVAQQKLILRRL